jgi:diguanylate cyclase (GGDEF)-like protein
VPTGNLFVLSLVAIGVILAPILLGFVGVGIAIFNFVAAFLLYITAKEYGSVYHEAPIPVVGMMTLYLLTAVSFFLCGCVIVYEQQWVMTSLPSNLAEDFNAMMALIGITGIGALSLTFTQSRIARRHANEARTDSLTGLLNRRALYDSLAVDEMRAGDSVIVFDLDAFKSINDSHGHTVGDRVLLEFASIIRAHAGQGAIIARIGGEEFVLILRQTSNVNVLATADKIRKAFASASFDTTRDPFSTTTSAGIAFLTAADSGFETVFRRADAALYRAKDLGRNRICTELQIVA